MNSEQKTKKKLEIEQNYGLIIALFNPQITIDFSILVCYHICSAQRVVKFFNLQPVGCPAPRVLGYGELK